ncbi:carbohydrate esterase family 16 protein [Dothistroma septosporum NZE10]|uniref:Carbohydrate esterase family 16 protein n=1 Tax=Dothistroma septosporum (strain NZE10 / CBS 128990) TaxID=675120 RepID=N1PRI7_DOTSN|nr:carbohydrate esterase family 16 protein [Dothistroma septosporum NZE10]
MANRTTRPWWRLCPISLKLHIDYWPGWSGISHMFVFGDSYTTTGFEVNGTQPSAANPFGNPPYPGYTSSNGPNWIDFLTTTWNQSFVETINLAYGGATVDGALIPPYLPTVLSVRQQVNDDYLPSYATHPETFDWRSKDTLFAIFIGINDVGNAYGWSNSTVVFDKVLTEYAGLVDKLYQSGAKNFLFLEVPPVDRSPLTQAAGSSAQSIEKEAIASWNDRVAHIAQNLSTTHQDATTFVFDTNALFTQVLNKPSSYKETSPYKNTTGYCEAYENGTPSWYTKYDNCTYAVDEYFWLNTLHPTFRMHNVTAKQIAKQLSDT